MNKIVLSAVLALASISAASAASASPISGLVNTGAGVSGTQDNNYTLTVEQGVTVLGNQFGYTSYDNQWPISPWLGNSAGSKWITPLLSQSASFDTDSTGIYKYHLQFDLTGFDAASASFAARFAADNAAVVMLNGQQISSGSSFSNWSNFSATTGFNAGVNSLDFLVTNFSQSSGNPTGLRVEFLNSSVSAVPEPASVFTLMTGLLLMGFVRSRRKGAIR